MKLTLHQFTKGSPTEFHVRLYLDLGSYSDKARQHLAKYQAPPLTDAPLEYDPHKPIPVPVLTKEELEQLTRNHPVERRFTDVRTAETYGRQLKAAVAETIDYWHRASHYGTEEDGEVIEFGSAD